ncbi:MAG TPA: glycoside hydrolase family 9 protein, partial [Bacteroidota bacterium]|nr:glycoside hydrolase family 9 protein [Bacteroidota bacterium]
MRRRDRILTTVMLCAVAGTSLAAGVVGVNQAGYTRLAPKIAILSQYADSVFVVAADSRAVVLRVATGLAGLGDPATGIDLYSADCSSLVQPGTYFLRTSAGDSSVVFTVGDSVYVPLFRASLKGFYYQRCGMSLSPLHAGDWWHLACHTTTDAAFHATAESTGTIASVGGWHDAGDYGKYIVNAGISVGTLLLAYEYFPGRFRADDLRIPESGNGVPDILDEARFELKWMQTMQAASGGVYFNITKTQFESFVMPQNDTGQRYIYRLSSTATGNFAAVMARAARVYHAYDSLFASSCLSAARQAWSYLLAHPAIVPTGGFTNPAGTVTGEYGDGNDSDERLWAAAELYLATGDSAAHDYFLNSYQTPGVITGTMTWGDVRALAQCTYLRGSRSGINTAAQDRIRQSLLSYCTTLVRFRDESGFRAAIRNADYNWGSNSQVLNNALLLILGRTEGGAEVFAQAALDQLHYVLGVNIHGFSFVTGTGTQATRFPHHRPSGSDGIAAPVPGLLAGGPNRNVSQDPVLAARFAAGTPPARCYVDDQGSYASNEIAINWNAPLVAVAGYLAA